MNAKTTMVLVALIGAGLFALPQTTALFAGQHTFVNIDATGNQIECTKCHGDIQAEITAQGTSTTTGTDSPHKSFKCEFCHRIEAGSASGDNGYGDLTYKNATPTADGIAVSRKLVVGVMDMEGKNIPAQMTSGDTYATIRVAPTISGNGVFRNTSSTGAQIAISVCYPTNATGCTDLTTVLLPPPLNNWKLSPLYNATTHSPIDTSAAATQAFDVTKVKWTTGVDGFGTGVNLTINLTGAGSRAVNPGTAYHAASLVSCMECHGGDEPMGHNSRIWDGTQNGGKADCTFCHYGTSSSSNFERKLWAGGFGLTQVNGDTGASEAHKVFQTTPDNMSRQKLMENGNNSNNGACVACHTHVAVDIQYTRPTTYGFTSVTGTDGQTVVDNFVATGSNVTYSTP